MGLTMRGKSGPPQVSARRCPLLLIRPVRRPRTLVPRLIACRGFADVPTMELCSQREPPRVLRRERHDGRVFPQERPSAVMDSPLPGRTALLVSEDSRRYVHAMRVAVISDVHGNLPHLSSALRARSRGRGCR
jgi:hypothetical protein